MKKLTLSPKYLNQRLRYDPDSGKLYWKNHFLSARYVGEEAFTTYNKEGYLTGKIDGDRYLAHRVIWLMYWGILLDEWQIDHENHRRDDNRMSNLNVTDSTGQRRNQSLRPDSFSGVIGVYWVNERQKWVATIKHKGKTINLGRYDDIKEAIEARLQAEVALGYHRRHGEPVW